MTEASTSLYVLRNVAKSRLANGSAFELCIESLEIRSGSVLAITGESGSGKSTLLDMLALGLRPDRGTEFRFRPSPNVDVDILSSWAAWSDAALGRLRLNHLGYVLQTGGLLPFLTVADNIALPSRLRGTYLKERVHALAERLGIADQLAKHPAELSIGQRQRAAIARALVHNPALVLADEPTASADPATGDVIMETILDMIQASGATLVLATHDLRRVAELGLPRLRIELERHAGGTFARAVAT